LQRQSLVGHSVTDNMTPFESWSNGLDWPEESLIDQRERLMRQILGPKRYAERLEKSAITINHKVVTEKQLSLFE